jgi:hypothetical protein
MTQFDKLALTRRGALKAGLASVAASGAMFGATRSAFADDTLAEITEARRARPRPRCNSRRSISRTMELTRA